MTSAKTKSVNMNFPALYSYILNTNYRNISGVIGILISLMSIAVIATSWDNLTNGRKFMFVMLAALFTVVNPAMLAFKAFKQLKLSPSYRTPLEYVFGDDGISVSQGTLHQDIEWSGICRIMMTRHMLAIYTGRYHAFVIPLKELADDKGKIIASVVQFTAEYRPRLSGNLKRYQSGKGI